MTTREFAEKELNLLMDDKEDKMQEMMNRHILTMCQVFDDEGHSGFSAGYAVNMLEKLLRFIPITPVTNDDGWHESSFEKNVLYSNRSSRICMRDGKIYDSEARIFSKDGGETWFSNSNSKKEITLPYLIPTHPERIIIEGE